MIYIIVLGLALGGAALVLASGALRAGWPMVAFGLSLWTTLVFGTFVAHELAHRRSRTWIRCGSFVAGVCGYPILALEDAVHHNRPGNVSDAQCAAVDEAMWSFAGRRARRAIDNAFQINAALRRAEDWKGGTPLTYGLAGTLCTGGLFWAVAGHTGFTVYACAATGVALSMQVMGYVQHWGLGDDDLHDAAMRDAAWEDDCQMQAWITLNNAFHQAHHHARETPYFLLQPSTASARQPGCYVVMLALTLLPGAWRTVMKPVLASWKADESFVCQPGRRVICFKPGLRR